MANPVLTVVGNATKHAILRTISVICVLLVCAGIYYAVYRTFIKPRPTESYSQKANQIQNYEYHYDYSEKDIAFLGIKLWKIRLGITIK
jgi:uncharacterized membrane protein